MLGMHSGRHGTCHYDAATRLASTDYQHYMCPKQTAYTELMRITVNQHVCKASLL